MADKELETLQEIGFALAWIGFLCGIFCFIIICAKAREQISNLNKNETDSKSTILRKDTLILLICGFGCIIFTTIYCSFYATYGIFPMRLNIYPTEKFCEYFGIRWPGVSWNLHRYFFYIFMLWRIQASFREPVSLMLSKYTIYIFLFLIHIWLILAVSISAILSPFWFKTPTGICVLRVPTFGNNFSVQHLRTILLAFDTILTVGLLALFLRRLYQLTSQNQKINKYKKKTLVLGLTATITSSVMVLLNFTLEVNQWRYFVPADCTINLLCVVFTYKLSWKIFGIDEDKYCGCCEGKNSKNIDYDQQKQESTISKQPNDSVVWNMLVRSNDNHDGEDKGNNVDSSDLPISHDRQTTNDDGQSKSTDTNTLESNNGVESNNTNTIEMEDITIVTRNTLEDEDDNNDNNNNRKDSENNVDNELNVNG